MIQNEVAFIYMGEWVEFFLMGWLYELLHWGRCIISLPAQIYLGSICCPWTTKGSRKFVACCAQSQLTMLRIVVAENSLFISGIKARRTSASDRMQNSVGCNQPLIPNGIWFNRISKFPSLSHQALLLLPSGYLLLLFLDNRVFTETGFIWSSRTGKLGTGWGHEAATLLTNLLPAFSFTFHSRHRIIVVNS